MQSCLEHWAGQSQRAGKQGGPGNERAVGTGGSLSRGQDRGRGGTHAGERKAGPPLEGAQEQAAPRPQLMDTTQEGSKVPERNREAMLCLLRARKAGVHEGP